MSAVLSTSHDGRYQKIAEFENATEAMMCLPAIARILKKNVRMVSNEEIRVTRPEGCDFDEKGFMGNRYVYRV